MVAENSNLLFGHVRKGELEEIKKIIDERNVDIELCDEFNNSPLYLACLCQHKDVVAYLLENGAKYEPSSTQGERCYLAAQDFDIRNLLKDYGGEDEKKKKKKKRSSAPKKQNGPQLDAYREFLLSLRECSETADVAFEGKAKDDNDKESGVKYSAHKYVLAARCPYLANHVNNTPKDKTAVPLDFLEDTTPFPHILDFLYTARTSFSTDLLDGIVSTANTLELCDLAGGLKKQKNQVEKNKKKRLSAMWYPGNPQEVKQLKADLGRLALRGIPYKLEAQLSKHGLPNNKERSSETYHDIVFSVEEQMFMGHKAFFCGRSDTLKELAADVIDKNVSSSRVLPLITVNNISADIFAHIMVYIYSDSCTLTESNILGMFSASKQLNCMPLHHKCSRELQHFLTVSNIVSALVLVRELGYRKLTDKCKEFIANNLSAVMKESAFEELLHKECQNANSSNTSQIPLVEDIAYYIRQDADTVDQMIKANEKTDQFNVCLKRCGIPPIESRFDVSDEANDPNDNGRSTPPFNIFEQNEENYDTENRFIGQLDVVDCDTKGGQSLENMTEMPENKDSVPQSNGSAMEDKDSVLQSNGSALENKDSVPQSNGSALENKSNGSAKMGESNGKVISNGKDTSGKRKKRKDKNISGSHPKVAEQSCTCAIL